MRHETNECKIQEEDKHTQADLEIFGARPRRTEKIYILINCNHFNFILFAFFVLLVLFF